MEKIKKYDIIVLGSGIGLDFAWASIEKGLKCAVVEPSKFGGTCLTKGCIPSKVLTTVADCVHEAKNFERIGVKCAVEDIDIEKIYARMDKKIAFSSKIEEGLSKEESIDIYKGYGQFTGDKTIRVKYDDGTYSGEITAHTVVVCIGARTFVPPIEGLEDAGYITSETFFDGTKRPSKIPESIAILGAGAIGMEFAHFFSCVSAKVKIIEMQDEILPAEDEDIRKFARKNAENSGIEIFTGSKAVKAYSSKSGKILEIVERHSQKKDEVYCEEIFVASGIKPNSDLAKIENTGIKTDERGWIITDKHLRTNIKGIWALGDINGKFQFRHKANYEGEICVHNVFNPDSEQRAASYESVPWAIFGNPQIAHLGLTLDKALEKHRGVYLGVKKYSSIAKGYAMGFEPGDEDDGFVKIITDENFRILGAHIAGPQASVLIQPYVYLMNAGCSCVSGKKTQVDSNTLKPISESMVIHPALSELTAWVVSEMKWVE